jgi:hypothetical protein
LGARQRESLQRNVSGLTELVVHELLDVRLARVAAKIGRRAVAAGTLVLTEILPDDRERGAAEGAREGVGSHGRFE